MVQHQLVLENDVDDISKKMNERDVSSLVNHILTCNLWSILELAMVKKLIEKYQKFYQTLLMQHLNLYCHVINNEQPDIIHHPIQLELQINHRLQKQYLIG